MSQSDKLDSLKKRSGKAGKSNLNSNLDQNEDSNENISSISQENLNQNEEISTQDTSSESSNSSNGENDSSNFQEIETEVKIQSLKAEVKDWQQRTARLSAEIANLQKQQELDLAGAKKSGKKTVASHLIVFLNTLNLAFSFAPQSDDIKIKSFIATLENSFGKVINDLNLAGIEIISPKPQDDFNPETMSALDVAPDSEENPKVSKIAGLGYKIDGQVVQPASVLLG